MGSFSASRRLCFMIVDLSGFFNASRRLCFVIVDLGGFFYCLKEAVLITKTCLYDFDPFKTHLYIVKLWFTGVYIIFLISAQKHRCGYSLARRF